MKHRLAHGLLLAVLAAPCAHAAGGHHAIDDASLLDPGQCQLEGWIDRRRGGGDLLHLGPGCRWGPLEWGLNIDRVRAEGERSTDLGLQLKWATALAGDCSIGAVAAASWSGEPRRHAGTTLLLPLSCVADGRALHLNLGRDFWRSARDEWRGGLAVEQPFGDAFTAVGELYREGGVGRWRAALRWTRDALSIDLGRQQATAHRRDASWTLGLNLVFGP